MRRRIRVLVVDDEVHARRGLRTLLAQEAGVDVVGEAGNGTEAIAAIRELRPDLVLLDVEMPDTDGMQVVAEIGPRAMPAVIFVTAYDQYAVSAFEAHAVDYLLKPFTDERFAAALDRARKMMTQGGEEMADRLTQLISRLSPGGFERFTVKVGKELRVFHIDEIDWIEADEYYCRLHIGGSAHLIRHTMGALEQELPSDRFIRIHRSAIVNVARIAALEPMVQGDCTVILKDGARLRMSRRRREALAGVLGAFS